MALDATVVGQYEMMVGALMSTDNNVRNQAEAAFNSGKANPDVHVSALVHLLRRNESEQVRSLGAVLLRKSVMQSASHPGQSLIKKLSPAVAELAKKSCSSALRQRSPNNPKENSVVRRQRRSRYGRHA